MKTNKYLEALKAIADKPGKSDPRRTPAPKKDQKKGSKKNKPDSAKDDKGKITFNENTTTKLKNKVSEHNKKGKGSQNKLNFYIVRKGKIPGTHSVTFENKQEKLKIEHTAHSRDLFAEGAIGAAKWLAKKRPGLYNMHHVLGIK